MTTKVVLREVQGGLNLTRLVKTKLQYVATGRGKHSGVER